MSAVDSLDGLISSALSSGAIHRMIGHPMPGASTTSATATLGGGISAQRFNTWQMPSSFGAGITGGVMVACDSISPYLSITVHCCAIEYLLGSLNVASGGTFTDGVAMPTKKSRENGVTTTHTGGASMVMLVARNTHVSTSPIVTMTYVNQDGVGGRTAQMALSSNVGAKSAFLFTKNLQSGDTGVRDVTNLTIGGTSNTSGIYDVYGLFPLSVQGTYTAPGVPFAASPLPQFLIEASDTLAFYRFLTNGNSAFGTMFTIIPDDF